ncbi:MAG: hypothetical protein LV479_04475 [Methylacidiphilales bacterium]|nr:hypothetical protein [Candidatus Methylacidiphilales bacterium]
MLPSRKITATFIGVFLIGAMAGSLITWDFSDMRFSRFLNRTSDPDSMAARINQKYASDYHLTPEEQTKIAPLTKEMAQQLYQVRSRFANDVITTMNDYHQKIAEQMDPDHRTAYEQANIDRMKRMNNLLMTDPGNTSQDQK